jgi:hypothetical protein
LSLWPGRNRLLFRRGILLQERIPARDRVCFAVTLRSVGRRDAPARGGTGAWPIRSIIAIVDRADSHTVIRTATLTPPFATRTAFAIPVMAMPATGAALA